MDKATFLNPTTYFGVACVAFSLVAVGSIWRNQNASQAATPKHKVAHASSSKRPDPRRRMAVDSLYADEDTRAAIASKLAAVSVTTNDTRPDGNAVEGLIDQCSQLSQQLRSSQDEHSLLLAELAMLMAALYRLRQSSWTGASLNPQAAFSSSTEPISDTLAYLRTSLRLSHLDESAGSAVAKQIEEQRNTLERLVNNAHISAWPPTPPCEMEVKAGTSRDHDLMPSFAMPTTGLTPMADTGAWIEPPPEYSPPSDPSILARVEKSDVKAPTEPTPPENQDRAEEQVFDTDALYNAVTNEELELVSDLLEQDATPDEPVGELQRTALHQAAHLNSTACIAVLLRYSASMTVEDAKGDTPVHLAAWSNSCEALSALLAHGADVDWLSGRDGYSPLWCAVSAYHIDAARLLLKHGARVSLRSTSGAFLLHQAAVTGQSAMCELLLERGAQVDSLDSDGQTALQYAAASGSVPSVKVMLRGGANVSLAQAQGLTSAHWAAHKGHTEVLDLVLSYGADINAQTEQGATTLHMAANRGHIAAVRLLLEKGAAVDVEAAWDGTSGTPEDMAREKCHRRVAKLLASWDTN
ncbi:hypothetical protein LTR78_009901 [Recurvomyces mirabilis]|uniref:Ankyrin repeat protein n=1 Tax=Recurvomyces mirabilis TaxID=574656 RepID=A0AAE0TT38_9PEZI|nr:hypothetical protein LTR78_009901 [Recurvomyces mirabilis]KAK5150576.1 hypothetical protein LTS14_010070 [Recurvomyces mirabilis]